MLFLCALLIAAICLPGPALADEGGVPVDVVMVGENFGTQYLGSYYFSENVRVVYNRPGEVTLTAKLKYGTTRTFTLKIVQDEPPCAQKIAPERDVIEMTVGQSVPCPITTEPSPAKILDCVYAPEDTGVVTADEYGALTAAALCGFGFAWRDLRKTR